jgi:hypothetical protein
MIKLASASEQVTKKEFFLDIDDYGECASYEGLFAIAKLLQTLFLLIPGTYPNHPEMGIGLTEYQFEFMDDETKNELQFKANRQIGKYLPTYKIMGVTISFVKDDATGKQNTLSVLVNIANDDTGDVLDAMNSMVLTFEQLGKTGKIVSKLYI